MFVAWNINPCWLSFTIVILMSSQNISNTKRSYNCTVCKQVNRSTDEISFHCINTYLLKTHNFEHASTTCTKYEIFRQW